MSDVKKEIIFANSMTADKRNADFAYLRKNLFPSRSPGLYPAIDFQRQLPDNLSVGKEIVDVLGSDDTGEDVKVIVEVSDDSLNFYNLGANGASNDALSGVDGYECGTYGDDGVHFVAGNDHLYKLHDGAPIDDTEDLYTFLEGAPRLAGFDGLYYWWLSSGEIYKQLDNDDPTIAFNDLGLIPDLVDFLGDQMVIFSQEGADILILFWDKSDTDLFDKRILVRNAVLVAAGVVNGRLMLVRSIGNSANIKERNGELVISGYDGEKFVRMNSIRTGQNDTRYENLPMSVGVGSEVLVFSVDENDNAHNPDLYQNYIYKVFDDGAIEVVTLPNSATLGDARVVRAFYNFILYSSDGDGVTTNPHLFINEDAEQGYTAYEKFTETTYITNFLCSAYNLHKLDGLLVAFEKLFEQTDVAADPDTGEQLDIYYRVSERDTWTLLGEVTAQKVKENVNARRDQSTEYATDDAYGLPEQRYVITKMPDGSSLPEFNEIQFKFVSKRGFSVIGAWFSYSYLTRITLP